MTPESGRPSDFTPTGSTRWDSSWPGSAKEKDRAELLGSLEERYGIPAGVFEPYALLEKGKSWWLLRESPHLELASGFKVFACGIKAFQRVSRFVKPTTRLIQLFGKEATRSIMDITDEQLLSLMRGEGIPSCSEAEAGYVILRLNKRYVLGLGLLIRGVVRSQIRKSYLQQISTAALHE